MYKEGVPNEYVVFWVIFVMERTAVEKHVPDEISIIKLKELFTAKFPLSPITPILMSLPDKIESAELIGQALIMLKILDIEKANNLNIQRTKEMVE
jgi:hypothetical protein